MTPPHPSWVWIDFSLGGITMTWTFELKYFCEKKWSLTRPPWTSTTPSWGCQRRMATESTKGLRGAVERILGADNGWFQWQWQMCHPYHIHETTRLTRSCVPLSQFPIHSSHSRGVLILCVCMWVSECTVCARESVCGGGRGDGGGYFCRVSH